MIVYGRESDTRKQVFRNIEKFAFVFGVSSHICGLSCGM
jgi:hypothetical protein